MTIGTVVGPTPAACTVVPTGADCVGAGPAAGAAFFE